MMNRALIVMLVVLNLGVAAWWIWHPDAAPATPDENLPSGIARLELLSERRSAATAAPRTRTMQPAATTPAATQTPTAAITAVPAPATPAAERCYRFGPFADAAALAAAQTALQPRILRLRARETTTGTSGRGWWVYLPPAADRSSAEATAAKIKAAGFSDYLIVADGSNANAIALGRFTSEARAEQHAANLRSAGFPAIAQALGDAKVQRWIELAADAKFDPAAARRVSGAAQTQTINCAGIR